MSTICVITSPTDHLSDPSQIWIPAAILPIADAHLGTASAAALSRADGGALSQSLSADLPALRSAPHTLPMSSPSFPSTCRGSADLYRSVCLLDRWSAGGCYEKEIAGMPLRGILSRAPLPPSPPSHPFCVAVTVLSLPFPVTHFSLYPPTPCLRKS